MATMSIPEGWARVRGLMGAQLREAAVFSLPGHSAVHHDRFEGGDSSYRTGKAAKHMVWVDFKDYCVALVRLGDPDVA